MTDEALLSICDLVVRYGATTALDGISLELAPGAVHAVVGENGAGKSTLLRAIVGLTRRQAGSIHLRRGARTAWVPQDTSLPPDLTPVEWIFLGRETTRRLGWLERKSMRRAAADSLRRIGSDAPISARLGALSPVQRKQVQLARAFHSDPDLLLLDEPTAVLGDGETKKLFSAVDEVRRRGGCVVYVSHRIGEVLSIADRVTVLRDGKVVSTAPAGELDPPTVVRQMVGRDIPTRQRDRAGLGPPVVRLVDACTAQVRDLSLTVHAGEIVGLAGLVGAGRSEVLEAIARLRPLRSGAIACDGPIALVPEDRPVKGLVPTLHLRHNLCLPVDGWIVHRREEQRLAERWIHNLGIRAAGVDVPIHSLSGGNQQKLLLARALRHEPQILLLDEPTAGVDVGAKAEIHRAILDLASAGTAILLASSELPELLSLCDRIVALREGRVAGISGVREASEARLAAMITGAA